MAHLRPLMLVFLLAFSALAENEVKPIAVKPAPATSDAPPPQTPPPPPPPSPTVAPQPITNKPTVAPQPITKPTTKPPTTKPPTTPPPTTPTPTTTKPTAPTPPSTTTAAPPTPDPKKGTWSANFANTNVTCILVQAAIQIEIPYQDGNITKMVKVNVPGDANATGVCQDKQSSLSLEWDKVVNDTNDVKLEFVKNGTKFDLDKVTVTVNVTIPGSGSKVLQLVHVRNEFSTPVAKSYKCAKEQTLDLTTAASNETSGYFKISQVQLQAFHNATGTNFAEAMDCAGSETPDVVPIAVGCALATLVVIVLVAYLVGRRRSQARGYLSMFVENKREEDYIPMKNLSCFN